MSWSQKTLDFFMIGKLKSIMIVMEIVHGIQAGELVIGVRLEVSQGSIMNIPEFLLLDKMMLRTCYFSYKRTIYILRVPYDALSVPFDSVFFVPEMGPGTTIFGDPIPPNFST